MWKKEEKDGENIWKNVKKTKEKMQNKRKNQWFIMYTEYTALCLYVNGGIED